MLLAMMYWNASTAIRPATHSQPLRFSLIGTLLSVPAYEGYVGTIYLVHRAPRKERRLLHAPFVMPSTREGEIQLQEPVSSVPVIITHFATTDKTPLFVCFTISVVAMRKGTTD